MKQIIHFQGYTDGTPHTAKSAKKISDEVQDIKTDGLQSDHFEILLAEADSKENLLRWTGFFEGYNR